MRSKPERFGAMLGSRPRVRIVIEASTDGEWVARCLEALGREVIVADPNFAPVYATRTRKVKTDQRDARALAEIINTLGADFGALMAMQTTARMLSQLEFFCGLGMKLADAIGITGFLHIQEKLGEMLSQMELTRAVFYAAEAIARDHREESRAVVVRRVLHGLGKRRWWQTCWGLWRRWGERGTRRVFMLSTL